MANAAPLFYGLVISYINLVLWLFCLVVDVAALLHCVVQRAEGFPAIGTLSKPIWLGLLGGGLLLTAISPYLLGGVLSIFPLIAIGIAAVYLLDVRPALRDAVDGQGSW
jgi:Protein of unknown function (DUF2516)